jgi:hypothetical protein
VWRRPWLSFSSAGPSTGSDALLRVQWLRGKTLSAYGLWQRHTQSTDAPEAGAVHRNRFRLHAQYQTAPGIAFRSRVEWMRVASGNGSAVRGFMAYQEAVVKPLGKPWSGVVRYALFDTDAYEARVYAFEADLFSAMSVPGFAGKGARWFANASWKFRGRWRLEGRWEYTMLRSVVTEGSTIGAGQTWKLQLRWNGT